MLGGSGGTFRVAGRVPYDVADVLPPAARAKLVALRQDRADQHKLTLGIVEEIAELRLQRQSYESRRRQLVAAAQFGGFAKNENSSLVRAEDEKIAKVDGEIARLAQLEEVRSARWQATSQLLANVERWLSALPATARVASWDGEAPKLKKGENSIGALERVRHRIRELSAEAHAVRSAPITSEMAKARIAAQVEEVAARGLPDVYQVIEHGERLAWPKARAEVQTFPGPGGDHGKPLITVPDVLAILAWVAKDELLAKLFDEVDQRADDGAALTDEERAARLDEIATDLLVAERAEESLVELAAAEGFTIDRRPDANPMAILGLLATTDAADERVIEEAA
jgi:hypothetical protein